MPAPSIVSTTGQAATTGANGKDVTLPATINAGNTIVIVASTTYDNTYSLSGFTLVARVYGSSYSGRNCHVFKKTADGTEGGTTVTMSGGAGAVIGTYVAYALDSASGDVEATFADLGFTVANNPPSISPSWGAAPGLCASFVASTSSGNPSAAPSGYTGYSEYESAAQDGASAYKEISASSEDPGSFTASNSAWICATVAIKGAASQFNNLLFGSPF